MKIVESLISNNKKVIKYLQKTRDSHVIETGYYDLDEHIICISSQIGCLMGCSFCAVTKPIDSLNPKKPFIRNLTYKEIVQQVENILHKINQNKLREKKILFSYMGMGETFLNYKNVVESIKILSREYPNSRTTNSTTGVKPTLMKKFAQEKINTILKLHLSLHAPNDVLRRKIMPKAKQIIPALEALKYFSITRAMPSKVNYILIKNLNDQKKHAIQLAELLKSYPFIVKLSHLNKIYDLEPSGTDRFELFEEILNSHGIKTCRFFSAGTDIQAGCGQFRRRFYNKIGD